MSQQLVVDVVADAVVIDSEGFQSVQHSIETGSLPDEIHTEVVRALCRDVTAGTQF